MRATPPIAIVTGPTGVGKTEACLVVAESIGAEIVSADSRQVYRGMEIGTAAPTTAQRDRVPHHLIGILDPREPWSAGTFGGQAADAIADIRDRGLRPLVVGGSGFYLRALTEGLFDEPDVDPETRQKGRHALQTQMEAVGLESLWRELQEVDPRWASDIEPTDTQRIMRGLEAYRLHGRPLSELQQEGNARAPIEADWRIILLTREREDLYRRIDERVGRMMGAGWLDEAQRLREAGIPADAPGLTGLGYAQLYAHLEGDLSIEEAIAGIRAEHRHYAKRQLTWFRSLPGVRRVHLGKDDGARDTSSMILDALSGPAAADDPEGNP